MDLASSEPQQPKRSFFSECGIRLQDTLPSLEYTTPFRTQRIDNTVKVHYNKVIRPQALITNTVYTPGKNAQIY